MWTRLRKRNVKREAVMCRSCSSCIVTWALARRCSNCITARNWRRRSAASNHMYHQTRYCSAAREKRDMSRVVARVNAVSTSTDDVSASLTDSLLGRRQHDTYMPPRPPPPPCDDKLRCRVIRPSFGVLHGQITAASTGDRRRRTELGSRLTVGLQRLKALTRRATSCWCWLETMRTKHGRVNKIVACDAVYYPPSSEVSVRVCWRRVDADMCPTWRGHSGISAAMKRLRYAAKWRSHRLNDARSADDPSRAERGASRGRWTDERRDVGRLLGGWPPPASRQMRSIQLYC